jgi:hypothetical protein
MLPYKGLVLQKEFGYVLQEYLFFPSRASKRANHLSQQRVNE